jgi:hypothetical protein
MTVIYSKWPWNIPTFSFQSPPPKFTQIWFENIPSGNPDVEVFFPRHFPSVKIMNSSFKMQNQTVPRFRWHGGRITSVLENWIQFFSSRGRCYDHNFRQFLAKNCLFLKNNAVIKCLLKQAVVCSKNPNFFGENIFTIITSVAESWVYFEPK